MSFTPLSLVLQMGPSFLGTGTPPDPTSLVSSSYSGSPSTRSGLGIDVGSCTGSGRGPSRPEAPSSVLRRAPMGRSVGTSNDQTDTRPTLSSVTLPHPWRDRGRRSLLGPVSRLVSRHRSRYLSGHTPLSPDQKSFLPTGPGDLHLFL